MWYDGRTPGSSSSEPIGTKQSPRSVSLRGMLEPHTEQNECPKYRAPGSLYVVTRSSPRVKRSPSEGTVRYDMCAAPPALRHREQWQVRHRVTGPFTTYVTPPHRQ